MISEETRNEPTDDENPYQTAVAPLCNGVVRIYEPELKNVQTQLRELTDKGARLQVQIHDENLKIAEMQYSSRLQEIFSSIQVYHTKLVNIKKDMKSLHDKSIKLKKRASKLQQMKEKQDYLLQQKVTATTQK